MVTSTHHSQWVCLILIYKRVDWSIDHSRIESLKLIKVNNSSNQESDIIIFFGVLQDKVHRVEMLKQMSDTIQNATVG